MKLSIIIHPGAYRVCRAEYLPKKKKTLQHAQIRRLCYQMIHPIETRLWPDRFLAQRNIKSCSSEKGISSVIKINTHTNISSGHASLTWGRFWSGDGDLHSNGVLALQPVTLQFSAAGSSDPSPDVCLESELERQTTFHCIIFTDCTYFSLDSYFSHFIIGGNYLDPSD